MSRNKYKVKGLATEQMNWPNLEFQNNLKNLKFSFAPKTCKTVILLFWDLKRQQIVCAVERIKMQISWSKSSLALCKTKLQLINNL